MVGAGNGPNPVIILGAIVLMGSLLVAGFLFFAESDKYKCENGVFVDDPLECSCPSDFECCSGTEYQELSCQTGLICKNNVCEKKACIFQCCEGEEFFNNKRCSRNETCEFRVCVKNECPFDCCDGSTYEKKSCNEGFECNNTNCVEIPNEPEILECPNECCENLEGFEDKACAEDETCSENSCVTSSDIGLNSGGSGGSGNGLDDNTTPACPFDCCESGDFETKFCSGSLLCENNQCVMPACPFDCCESGDFETKFCSGSLLCENNQCVMPACPFDCCEDNGVHLDKACALGEICNFGICFPEVIDCGESIACIFGTLLTCQKSSADLAFAGDIYAVDILGESSPGFCELTAVLTSSVLTPEREGDSINCDIPYTAQVITTAVLEDIITGENIEFC